MFILYQIFEINEKHSSHDASNTAHFNPLCFPGEECRGLTSASSLVVKELGWPGQAEGLPFWVVTVVLGKDIMWSTSEGISRELLILYRTVCFQSNACSHWNVEHVV